MPHLTPNSPPDTRDCSMAIQGRQHPLGCLPLHAALRSKQGLTCKMLVRGRQGRLAWRAGLALCRGVGFLQQPLALMDVVATKSDSPLVRDFLLVGLHHVQTILFILKVIADVLCPREACLALFKSLQQKLLVCRTMKAECSQPQSQTQSQANFAGLLLFYEPKPKAFDH